MLSVSYTNLRRNLKTYFDKVVDDNEAMIITKKDNKNVVLISEKAYNNLLENAYITSSKANYDWLIESKKQLETSNLKIQ